MTANPLSEAIAPPAPAWSLARRLAFRFCCVYFVLYCLPFPVNRLASLWREGLGPVLGYFEVGSNAAIGWFGEHLLRLDPASLKPFPTGSGDTTRNYVSLAIFASLAFVATIVWSLTLGRPSHPRMAALLRTYLRYLLATTMLSYGTAKFGSGQFPPLAEHPDWLLTTWGDGSPMGVVWKFMGASPAYTAFSGFVECLGGVLLLWRRTATLGALVTAGAMLNVAMLNYCYDVPVKQYSTHLLLFAVWIAGRDCGVLWDALIRHRPTRPMPLRAARPVWVFVPEQLLKYAFVGWILYQSGVGLYGRVTREPEAAPLAKLYEVTSFRRDDAELPPLLTDATRWRYLAVMPSSLSVRMTDGKTRQFAQAEFDGTAKTITRKLPTPKATPTPTSTGGGDKAAEKSAEQAPEKPAAKPAEKPGEAGEPAPTTGAEPPPPLPPQVLTWSAAGDDGKLLRLQGFWDGARLDVTLREVPAQEFLVINRGFHWVQEYPFNR